MPELNLLIDHGCRRPSAAAAAAGYSSSWQPEEPTRLPPLSQPRALRGALLQRLLLLHPLSRLQKKLQPEQPLPCWLRRPLKWLSMQSSAPRPRRHNRSQARRSAGPLGHDAGVCHGGNNSSELAQRISSALHGSSSGLLDDSFQLHDLWQTCFAGGQRQL